MFLYSVEFSDFTDTRTRYSALSLSYPHIITTFYLDAFFCVIITFFTTIDLKSHGYMFFPCPRNDFDVSGLNRC